MQKIRIPDANQQAKQLTRLFNKLMIYCDIPGRVDIVYNDSVQCTQRPSSIVPRLRQKLSNLSTTRSLLFLTVPFGVQSMHVESKRNYSHEH